MMGIDLRRGKPNFCKAASRPGKSHDACSNTRVRTGLLLSGVLVFSFAGLGSVRQGDAQELQERRHFGPWEVACLEDNRCIAANTTPRIQAFYGWILSDQSPRLVLRIPPGAEVGDPIALRLDSGWGADFRVLECGPEWCQTMVDRDQTDSVLGELQQAGRATVAYLFGDRIIIAELSLAELADAAEHMAARR